MSRVSLENHLRKGYTNGMKASNAAGLVTVVILLISCTSPNENSFLVREAYFHIRPAWSPDGLSIAYTDQTPGAEGIYVMDSSGANSVKVRSGEGVGISWSPDSKWLAFSANGNLWKMKANGDSVTQLTFTSQNLRPSWSPDGSKIVYRSDGIWILNVATMQSSPIKSFGDFPTWLSDSTILYLVGSAGGFNLALYTIEVMDTTGSNPTVIKQFSSSFDYGFMSKNPAQNVILFSARPFNFSDRSQIRTYTPASDQFAQLTSQGGDYPAWSPDGSKIVYTNTEETEGGLWVMNANGSNKRRLTRP